MGDTALKYLNIFILVKAGRKIFCYHIKNIKILQFLIHYKITLYGSWNQVASLHTLFAQAHFDPERPSDLTGKSQTCISKQLYSDMTLMLHGFFSQYF